MNQFNTRIRGIPCIIKVTSWDPYLPAKLSGPPEDCYPSEGGFGEFEVLTMRGSSASWLTKKLCDQEWDQLEMTVFEHMEQR